MIKERLLQPLHPLFPHFVRQLYFPLVQRYKGERLLANLSALMRSERLSPDALRARQERFLADLARDARQIPFWRERLKEAPDPLTRESLSRLPLLSKEDVRTHYQALSRAGARVLQEGTTSGSTGIAVRVKLSAEHQASNFACQWLGRSWYGVTLGDPGVWIWGRPVASRLRRAITTLKARLNNLLLLQIFDLSEQTLAAWWREIRIFRPVYLYGYASALDRLAEYIESQGARVDFPVKLVSTTAEVLHDLQRERLGRVFGAPVANEYGSTESGSIAFECPEGGWHLMTEHTLVEFLGPEGEPVPPGALGEVIVTPLQNRLMPLFRYRLGDMGRPSDRSCHCGRPWPLMEMGVGKTVEMVKTPSGRLLSGALFHYINRGLLEEGIVGIRAFRVVQRRLDDFLVEYVPEGDSSARALQFFEEQMRRLIGEPVSIAFTAIPELRPEPSGKLRYFVSRV